MSRLIRLDRTGHTELASWTAEDADSQRGGDRGVPPRARRGDAGERDAARRLRRGRARAAARRRAGRHAAPDRGRLEHGGRVFSPKRRRCRGGGGQASGASRREGRIWTLWSVGIVGDLRAARRRCWSGSSRSPAPVSAIFLAHGIAVLHLQARRGARGVKPIGRAEDPPARAALGLLGDLWPTTRGTSRADGARAGARPARDLAGRAGGRGSGSPRRTQGALLLRAGRRGGDLPRRRPGGSPAARAARGRGGIRDGREPQLLRVGLASLGRAAGRLSPGPQPSARARR